VEKVNDTTYKVVDTTSGVEVVVGDETLSDQFLPRVKIKRWENEANISVSLVDDGGSFGEVGSSIEWSKDSNVARFYSLTGEKRTPDKLKWYDLGEVPPCEVASSYDKAFDKKEFAIYTSTSSEPALMLGGYPAECHLKLAATLNAPVEIDGVILNAGTRVEVEDETDDLVSISVGGTLYSFPKSETNKLVDIKALDFNYPDKSEYFHSEGTPFPTHTELPCYRVDLPHTNPYYYDSGILTFWLYVGDYDFDPLYLREKWRESLVAALSEAGVSLVAPSTSGLPDFLKYSIDLDGRKTKIYSDGYYEDSSVFAGYLNFSTPYNKAYDFYKPAVEKDIRNTYADGLNLKYPDVGHEVFDSAISKFSAALGLPYENSSLNEGEMDSLNETQTKYDWVSGAERSDGWFGYLDNRKEGFEFDIVLNSRPEGGKVQFSAVSKNTSIYEQPRLTREEKKNRAYRNIAIDGSYAVYRKGVNSPLGKLTHIYKPIIISSDGVARTCAVELTGSNVLPNGEIVYYLDAILPSQGITYPATLDPTFGFTSTGASAQSTHNAFSGGIAATGLETGPPQFIDSYSATIYDSTNYLFGGAIYNSDDNTLLESTVDQTVSVNSEVAWRRVFFEASANSSITATGVAGLVATNVDYPDATSQPSGNDGRNWENLDNIKSGVTDYANPILALNANNLYSDWAKLSSWGFNIPVSAIVVGVKAEWEVNSAVSSGVKAEAVKISVGGTEYQKTDDTGFWPQGNGSGSAKAYIAYGGSTDTWGDYGAVPAMPSKLTPTNINSSNFATFIRIKRYAGSAKQHRIFNSKVTVTYYPAGSSSLQASKSYKIGLVSETSGSYNYVNLRYDASTDPGSQGFSKAVTYSGASSLPADLDTGGSPTIQDRIYSINATYYTSGYGISQVDTANSIDVSSVLTGHKKSFVDFAFGVDTETRIYSYYKEIIDNLSNLESLDLNVGIPNIVDVTNSLELISTNIGIREIVDFTNSTDTDLRLYSYSKALIDFLDMRDERALNISHLVDDVISIIDTKSPDAGFSLSDSTSLIENTPARAIGLIKTAFASAIEVTGVNVGVDKSDFLSSIDSIKFNIGRSLEANTSAIDAISTQAALNIVDKLESSELLQKLYQFSKLKTDSLDLLDDSSIDLSLSFLDSTVLRDTVEKVIGYQKQIVDEIKSIDSLLANVTQNFSDILGAVDDVTSSTATQEAINKVDLGAISDTLSIGITKAITDIISSSETSSKLASASISTVDDLGIRDSVFRGLGLKYVDNLNALDEKETQIAHTVVDTAGLIDAVSRGVGVLATAQIANTDTDLLDVALSFIDTAGGLDSVESQKGLVIAIADALGASDDLVRRHIGLIQTDIAGLIDAQIIDIPTTFKLALFIKEALKTAQFMEESLNQDANINFTSESLKFVKFMSEIFKGEGE